MSIFYFDDILINFNTTYYYKGNRITDRKRIAMNYFKNGLCFDIIGSVPIEFLFYDQMTYNVNYPKEFRVFSNEG